MPRDWYTVGELIAKLQTLDPNASALVRLGIHDSIAALDDTWGLPGNAQTVGINCVLDWNDNVFLLHATQSDFNKFST